MFRLLSLLVFKIIGWKVKGTISPSLKKYVMIVAPHTSNWDFMIGLFARSILRLETKYLAKKELFRPPYGWLFYALGGYPVDRSKHNNLTDAVVSIFNEKKSFSICITPEGTRKYSEKLKTGFHSIAQKAGVPIVMVAFDYATKTVYCEPPFFPSASVETDIETVKAYYRKFKGYNPELGIQ